MKPRCSQDLALTEKCLPYERGKIPDRANSKTRNGRKHRPYFRPIPHVFQARANFVVMGQPAYYQSC
jgi:hypothetical protein